MIAWPIYPSVSGSLNRFLATRRIKLDRRSIFDRRSPCNRFCLSDRASTPRRRSSPVRLSIPARLSCMAIAVPPIVRCNSSLISYGCKQAVKIAIATEGGRNTCVAERTTHRSCGTRRRASRSARSFLRASRVLISLQSFQPKARSVHAACASLRKVTSIRISVRRSCDERKVEIIARKMPLLMS